MPFPWKKPGQGSGETRWSTEAKKEQPQVFTGLLPARLGFRGVREGSMGWAGNSTYVRVRPLGSLQFLRASSGARGPDTPVVRVSVGSTGCGQFFLLWGSSATSVSPNAAIPTNPSRVRT